LQELEKRVTGADEALTAVREATAQLERRLAAIETGFAPRQSQDALPNAQGLWAGVL
jgi:phage shock protein A